MGIRETLNKNPTLTADGATGGIILIAIVYILWSAFFSTRVKAPTKAFYTDDDGKSYFVDKLDIIPPYDRNGKQAVRCYVYKCGNGQPFVGYMLEYTKDGKAYMEDRRLHPNAPVSARPGRSMIDEMGRGDTEVKRPGDEGWTSSADQLNAQDVTSVHCPEGSTDQPVPLQAE